MHRQGILNQGHTSICKTPFYSLFKSLEHFQFFEVGYTYKAPPHDIEIVVVKAELPKDITCCYQDLLSLLKEMEFLLELTDFN